MHKQLLRAGNAGLLGLALLFSSCEKEYTELVPVLTMERNASIAGAGTIRFLQFQNEQSGYAADSLTIYKTTNGGTSWQATGVPAAPGGITHLAFFNETSGICLKGGKVYVTDNSGQTWTYKAEAVFAGISASGKAVYGRSETVSVFVDGEFHTSRPCRVFVSNNQGSTFQHFKNVHTDNYDATYGYVTGEKVYIATSDTGYDDYLSGLDLVTGAADHNEYLSVDFIAIDSYPDEIVVQGNTTLIVSFSVELRRDEPYFWAAHQHTGGYRSASIFGDLVVAAGQNSIITNINLGDDAYFHEMLDASGKPFNKTFTKVQAISNNSFYVSGESGLIWKMTL